MRKKLERVETFLFVSDINFVNFLSEGSIATSFYLRHDLLTFLHCSNYRTTHVLDKHAVPIVGMSANSDSYSKECSLEAGMNLFLAKPFTMEELQSTLELFHPRGKVHLKDTRVSSANKELKSETI